MSALYEFRQRLHELTTQKAFSEALAFFKSGKTAFDATEIADNEMIVADLLKSLRGINAFPEGLIFMKMYRIQLNELTPPMVLNSLGWLLYSWHKQKYVSESPTATVKSAKAPASEYKALKEGELQEPERSIVEIIPLLVKSGDSYSNNLVNFLFREVIQAEKKRQQIRWHFLVQLCKSIPPEKLSAECYSFETEVKGKKRETELASPREDWYSAYSRALFELKEYKQSLELCKQALTEIKEMHYSNDIWFRRRIAQCHSATDELNEAIACYLEIIKKKREWFLLKELAECYVQQANYPLALVTACEAAVNPVPVNFKVELFEVIGDILIKLKQEELANEHFQLSALVRLCEGWSIQPALQSRLKESLPADLEELKKKKEIIKKSLSQYWQSNIHTSTDSSALRGMVLSITPKDAGIEGWIQSETGKKSRFFIPATHPLFTRLKPGMPVSYEHNDTPKGLKAIKIRIIRTK